MMFVRVIMVVVMIMPVRVGVSVMGMVVMAVFVVHMFDSRRDSYSRHRLRVELSADQQHQSRAEQWKQGNQPDLIEKTHVSGPLPPQQVDFVRLHRLFIAEQRDKNTQS